MTFNAFFTHSKETCQEITSLEKATNHFLNHVLEKEDLHIGVDEFQNSFLFSTNTSTMITQFEELLCWTYLHYSLTNESSLALTSLLEKAECTPLAFDSIYAQTLLSFTHFLQNQQPPLQEINIQFPQAIPTLVNDYCASKENVPFTPYQAKLGALLALIAKLTSNTTSLKKAKQLGLWHSQTLTSTFEPFHSLYTPESNYSSSNHLYSLFILFYALAQSTSNPLWMSYANKQLEHLKQQKCPPSPLILLLAHALKDSEIPLVPDQKKPTELFYDSSCQLITIRKPNWNLACTLVGGNTGLGSIVLSDLALINFAPQILPLGSGNSFGIDHSMKKEEQYPSRLVINQDKLSFLMQGTLRLTSDETQANPLGSPSSFPYQWVDVTLDFTPNSLNIRLLPLDFTHTENVVFTFYLTTPHCQLEDGFEQPRRSLEQYHGSSQAVLCSSSLHKLVITSDSYFEEMQLIPLGGGENYWGADFLLAFPLRETKGPLNWTVQWK